MASHSLKGEHIHCEEIPFRVQLRKAANTRYNPQQQLNYFVDLSCLLSVPPTPNNVVSESNINLKAGLIVGLLDLWQGRKGCQHEKKSSKNYLKILNICVQYSQIRYQIVNVINLNDRQETI